MMRLVEIIFCYHYKQITVFVWGDPGQLLSNFLVLYICFDFLPTADVKQAVCEIQTTMKLYSTNYRLSIITIFKMKRVSF